ncbi:helix-turn-helix domain-containing protein [Kitasatospora sp. NPDC057015]|uniref:helix-turn-helix domain-containing protein n=1 Tax=Kitasatospora sp. NPDC057015 TaxID=3346001 RepID=UPI003630AA8C
MLDALGVSKQQEQVYRALLRQPEQTLAELAEATGHPVGSLRRHLQELRTNGLVVKAPTRPARYRPTPPELAIDVLALSVHQRVDQAKLAAAELAELWQQGRLEQEPPVQIVQGPDANIQYFQQVQRSTTQEVLTFDMPPYVMAGVAGQTDVQLELMARGVTYRTIYDRTALADAEQLALARSLTRQGEKARVVDGLPMKLLIADRSTALVPFVLSEERQTLVLKASPLLDGLIALFEAQWRTATPLWGAGARADAISEADAQLLGFAAAGDTDEIIARKIGVNKRTVERRMRRLMDQLGARTRFQAGLQAARQGLLG